MGNTEDEFFRKGARAERTEKERADAERRAALEAQRAESERKEVKRKAMLEALQKDASKQQSTKIAAEDPPKSPGIAVSPNSLVPSLVVVLILLVSYLIFIAFSAQIAKTPTPNTSDSQFENAIKEYDESVTDDQLFANYSKYAGKKLLVFAQATKVGKDQIGRLYVITGYCTSFPDQLSDTERCICFVKGPEELATVFRGGFIQVTGVCFGRMESGLIVLTDAKVKPSH